MRPKSIVLFERLFLSNTLISILAVLINYGTLRADAVSRGKSAAGPLLGIALTLLVDIPLWFFVARRASRVGKWILILLYALNYFVTVLIVTRFQAFGALYSAMTLVATVLSFAALVMLFRKDARSWFARGGGRSPTDASIFE